MAEVSAQKEKAVARFETVTEPTQIVRLQKEVAQLEKQLETLETKWLDLSEQIEQMID